MEDAMTVAVVGALAVVVFEVVRHQAGGWRRRRTLLRLLKEEVAHLLEYIDARIDVGKKMLAAARQGLVLPGSSVPPPSAIYRTFLPEIAADLSTDHRSRLNILYGSADSMHAHFSGAEDRLLKLAGFTAIDAANDIVRNGIGDFVEHMTNVKALGRQFLEDSKEPFHVLGPKPKGA